MPSPGQGKVRGSKALKGRMWPLLRRMVRHRNLRYPQFLCCGGRSYLIGVFAPASAGVFRALTEAWMVGEAANGLRRFIRGCVASPLRASRG